MLNACENRRRMLVFAAAAIAAACSRPAVAQVAGLHILSPVTTVSASASSDLQPGYCRDIISGNNSRGPYRLSWAGIPASREIVSVNGRAALRGVDYALDYAKGTITFTSVLKTTGLAKVEYPVDSGRSIRNAAGVSVPVALDLYASGRSSLQLTGLYKQGAGQSENAGGVLGLQGKTQVSPTTSFTTALFTGMTPEGGGSEGGFGDRSAARFGAASSLGDVKLTGSYVRAGRAFNGSKDYGIAAGQDVQTYGLSYGPKAGRLSFSSGYQRVSREGAPGGATTSLNHSFKYAFAPQGQFLFTRKSVGSGANGVESSAVTDAFQIDSAIGTKSKVQLVWTDQTSASGGARDNSSTKVLKVTSSLVNNVAFNAAYQLAETSAKGDASGFDVGITAKPHKAVDVVATFSGRGSDQSGADNSGGIRIAASPTSHLKVSAGLTDRQTEVLGLRTRDLRLESQPFDFLKLTGGYAFTDSGSSTLVAREIAATATPRPYLKLDGGYKTRDGTGKSVDTARLDLTLSPWKSLGIVAALAENPEDSKGNIGYYRSKSLGLKVSVGILGFTGAYAYKDEHLSARRWFQTQAGIQLALARATQLTSGYEYSETEGYGASSRRISLGLRRDMGSDFNIWLTGSRTDTRDASIENDPTYEAQMKLGIRF